MSILTGLLNLCWDHGVPVLYLKELPRATKRITGMALSISGRPTQLSWASQAPSIRGSYSCSHTSLGTFFAGIWVRMAC